MIKTYYQLAKPGIIYGNAVTALAGFFVALHSHAEVGQWRWWLLLIAILVGLSLVMGGACVFNNYLDRDIDLKMERTKSRATVTGQISKRNTLIYGGALVALGLAVLYFFTNPTTLLVALIGVIVYVAIYTPSKRLTMHSKLIGSIAGATPPLVGYCAVTGRIDLGAMAVFLIFALWQMPHFYAIAIYRADDYVAAGLPTVPGRKGTHRAVEDILFFIIFFIVAAVLLAVIGLAGNLYLAIVLPLGAGWLWLGVQGLRAPLDARAWSRKMFLFSLVVVVGVSVGMIL
jgi:protoheme IX farnesyltransferase